MWLRQILIEIRQLREEVHIMSTSTTTGLTALTQAVSDLIAAVSTETDNVNTAITAISNAVAELGQSEDPQAQVALINTANANLQTASATVPAPPAAA